MLKLLPKTNAHLNFIEWIYFCSWKYNLRGFFGIYNFSQINCTTFWQEATRKFSEHGVTCYWFPNQNLLEDEAIALLLYFFGVLKTQIGYHSGKPNLKEFTIAGYSIHLTKKATTTTTITTHLFSLVHQPVLGTI